MCSTGWLLLLLLSHFSRVRLCATPQTAAHQAPPSLGFSRQEHWSGLPFPLQCMKGKSESEVAQLCIGLTFIKMQCGIKQNKNNFYAYYNCSYTINIHKAILKYEKNLCEHAGRDFFPSMMYFHSYMFLFLKINLMFYKVHNREHLITLKKFNPLIP